MPNYRRLRRERHIQEAEGYLELGMPEQALAMMLRLSEPAASTGLLEGDGRTNFLAGMALRELNRFNEAIPYLERAMVLIPDDIHIYLAMAWCYKRTGMLPLAIDALERAVEVDDREAILHYNLACYWCLAHNRAESLRYLARALEIDADFRDLIQDEPDFDALREDPEFQFLTGQIV